MSRDQPGTSKIQEAGAPAITSIIFQGNQVSSVVKSIESKRNEPELTKNHEGPGKPPAKDKGKGRGNSRNGNATKNKTEDT